LSAKFAAAAVTWDLNRDGNVTCEEWKQYASDLFSAADANHGGMLRRDEFANLTRQDKLFEVAGFHYFDAKGDGRITLAEVIDKPNPALALFDTDHDCVITPEERRGTGTDSRSPGRRKRINLTVIAALRSLTNRFHGCHKRKGARLEPAGFI
jgi:Ca2+-binding EF-hand superfamily protein